MGAPDDVRMSRFRRLYGESPLHLLALAASLALAGLAFVHFFDRSAETAAVLAWLFGAIVFHDLVLLPVYSLLDRLAARAHRRRLPRVGYAYLRVPALLSGLLLLVFLPRIFGLGEADYHRASGLTSGGYLERWLIATAVLFAVSAVVHSFVMRRRLPSRHVRRAVRPRAPQRRK
jgi:hypothetical protein